MNVQLYTFGSPRVGTRAFSTDLTNRLKEKNVFRVSNQADPVTMVPIFPFLHVPFNTAQYLIPSWHGINPTNHFKDAYVSNVKGKTWQNMKDCATTKSWSEQTQIWLQSAGSSSSGIQMYSAKALWMIMKALDWIVAKTLGVVGMAGGLGVLGMVTVIDQLTQILHQGVLESLSIKESVTSLISSIMKFLGRTVTAGTKLTVSFIRWVLDLLFQALSTMAYMALRLANS
jgi:triacylglycerol lipase